MSQAASKSPPAGDTSTDEREAVHLEKLETAIDRTQIDPVLDRRISRKFDKRIVPWLFGLWLLAFIDRSNIGNAKIDGLAAELNLLKGDRFNTALAIFYVPYICVDGQYSACLYTLAAFVDLSKCRRIGL
jgi:hypothetical protein